MHKNIFLKKIKELEEEKRKNETNELEIKNLQGNVFHLQNDIENYKKIKRNEKLDCYYNSQDLVSQENQTLKLENFIPTKIIYKIMEFLPHHDIISFRSLNKLSYNCMSFDYRFYSLLLTKIRSQQKNEIVSLQKKLDYFKSLAEKIPDEYLKASLVKFISLKEKFGDYVPPILHKAKKVFDLETETNNQKGQMGLNEEDMKKKFSNSFGGNLFKKMMGFNKNAAPQEEKAKIEKSNVDDINILAGKLLPQCDISVDMDFLKQIEQDRTATIKQVLITNFFYFLYLKLQAYEKAEDFMKILLKKGVQLCRNFYF